MENTFVIMDMEWIDCFGDVPCPTQIAAMRVDENWNQTDLFSRLIRPINESCQDWSHMAYSGANKEDFLSADDLETVLKDMDSWLRESDILLWWADEPAEAFVDMVSHMLGRELSRTIRLLHSVAGEKFGIKGSAYRIAQACGIKVPEIQHVSANDVEAVRAVMAGINETPIAEIGTPWQRRARNTDISLKYHYDPFRKLLHTAEGGCMQVGSCIQGFETLKSCIRKRLKPCPICCAKEYRKKSMELTRDVISKTSFDYIYGPRSKVFHTRNCAHAWRISYLDVQYSPYYKNCVRAGKRPCKFCKPEDHDDEIAAKISRIGSSPRRIQPAQEPIPEGMTRPLSKIEKRAWSRYVQSQKEKEAKDYSPDNQDAVTRSSAGYAFWSARGYTNFHVAGCPKLEGLKNIRGFARYRDAARLGLLPCRKCRPTAKHDLCVSVYREGKLREGETIEMLENLCEKHGYEHDYSQPYCYISTPVGKWKIHEKVRPVELWHVNLIRCRGSREVYHRQPKLLLSLTDTFRYIHDHDRALMKENNALHIRRAEDAQENTAEEALSPAILFARTAE